MNLKKENLLIHCPASQSAPSYYYTQHALTPKVLILAPSCHVSYLLDGPWTVVSSQTCFTVIPTKDYTIIKGYKVDFGIITWYTFNMKDEAESPQWSIANSVINRRRNIDSRVLLRVLTSEKVCITFVYIKLSFTYHLL